MKYHFLSSWKLTLFLLLIGICCIIYSMFTIESLSLSEKTNFVEYHRDQSLKHTYNKYDGHNRNQSLKYTYNKSRKAKSENRTCILPTINPYKKSTLNIIRKETRRKTPPTCFTHPSYKFTIDLNTTLIMVQEPRTIKFWQITKKCCYMGFTMDESLESLSNLTNCIEITQVETIIPTDYSNINVLCFDKWGNVTYKDYFNFFRLNSTLERKLQSKGTYFDATEHLNLIFLGLDSVSATNFKRFLPKIRRYLLQNLSAIEFTGLNKVGLGTHENRIALISGCGHKKGKTVFPSKNTECHLVWEKFKKKGYRAILSDEQNNVFEYKSLKHNRNGTHNMDYTNFPFIKGIRHKLPDPMFTFGCFGHQFGPDFIANRIVQVASKMENKPYYHNIWLSLATHQVVEYTKYLEVPLSRLLTQLHERKHLNNTLLIFFSDHGHLHSNYLLTDDGQIEARNPLLYMVFPQWFRRKYSLAMKNLQLNKRALITPFDVHQTLLELIDLDKMMDYQFQRDILPQPQALGISLFRKVPFNRTCESGNIPKEYCICDLSWVELKYPYRSIIFRAVNYTLNSINNVLRANPQCRQLELKRIIKGKETVGWSGKTTYDIKFEVKPSNGVFGVILESSRSRKKEKLKIIGEVERQNKYLNQSSCLSKELLESGWLRSACFCR